MSTTKPEGPSSPSKPKRTLLGWLVRGALGLFLILVLGLLGLWGLTRGVPPSVTAQRQALDAMSLADRRSQAEDLEKEVGVRLSQTGRDRFDAPPQAMFGKRIIATDLASINAWLDVQWPQWLASHNQPKAKDLESAMVGQAPPSHVLNLRFVRDGSEQWLSILWTLDLAAPSDATGLATLRIQQVCLGRLPLPKGRLQQFVQQNVPEPAKRDMLLEAMGDGHRFLPIAKLDDRRQARLARLLVTGDKVELELDIEPAK